MKKILLALAALAMMSVSLTSCSKDEGAPAQFTASIEQSSAKIQLDGSIIKWKNSDIVTVFDEEGFARYSATPREDNATFATLNYMDGNLTDGPYYAIYPSVCAHNAGSFLVQSRQVSSDGSLEVFPMYAVSNNTNFEFKNLCGLLKITLNQSDVMVSSIKVTADQPIAGIFDIDMTSGVPVATFNSNLSDDTEDGITLQCETPQSIEGGHDFYIYLPAGTYTNMAIKVVTDNGLMCIKQSQNAVVVERSKYTPASVSQMTFVPNVAEGSLTGLFTINANGDQVRFSKGNLQYNVTNGLWRFAEHQYDFVGPFNNTTYYSWQIQNQYVGWIDLFNWGTSGYNNIMPHPLQITPREYYAENQNIANTNYDWGVYNPISNGGNQAGMWRTLTKEEWRYIRNTRPNANQKVASGRIDFGSNHYFNGLILLPDDWTLPEGLTFNRGFTNDQRNYARNTYTVDEWQLMEDAGAVFLSAAGFTINNGTSNDGVYYYLTDYTWYLAWAGNYWLSSQSGSLDAYMIDFHADMADDKYERRYWPASVRLVRDANLDQ